MVFGENYYVQAKLPPSIKKISNMYVYSDIVELSLAGYFQVLIISWVFIECNCHENNH